MGSPEAAPLASPQGVDRRSVLRRRAEPDFRALFEAAPGLFVVVEPNAPRHTVVAVSDAYLRATMTKREEMLGRGLFEVWPPNPAARASTAANDMTASLERVVRNRAADAMAIQKHEIGRREEEGGGREVRFWRPLNSPVFGRDGKLHYIIHRVEDVTESVALEQANRDALTQEERCRELFDSALDGIFVAGSDGRFVDVNPAGCRLLGYPREELLGLSIVELVPPGELARQAALVQRLVDGGTEVSEWVLRRKDGTSVAVELGASALPSGYLLGFARDMTERRRIEEALRLSEAKFSGTLATLADAIISTDETQHITMFNGGAEAIFGYSKAEIMGAPLETLIPERFRVRHREHMARFAAGKETPRQMGPRRSEIVGRRKNGEEFAADAAISKYQVDGEKLLTVSLRDISERKRVEDGERLLSEMGKILVAAGSDYERLLTEVASLLVRNVADWCSVDIVQDEDVRRLRVVHRDPAMAATCDALERYPAVRGRSSPVAEVLATKGSVLMSEMPPGWLESTAHDPEHLRLMRELDPGSFIVVPLLARGQTLGTLGLGAARKSRRYGAEDLRLVERLASRLALAVDNARLHQALERAVRSRDEVLGIVAHDLRNPLNAILLQTQVLRRRGPEPERRDQRAPERILGAARRMNRLIQDLLDVSRLEGRQTLAITRAAVSISGVLAEAVEQQQAAMAAADRALNVDVDEALPDVWADRTRLLQVLDNLLGNAIKFSRRHIVVSAHAKDGEVIFSVSDDGMGVSAEDLPRLFDRFWQATKTDRRGAGLGLSIVKGIIEVHGGRVWAESEVGKGTSLQFTLPMAPLATSIG